MMSCDIANKEKVLKEKPKRKAIPRKIDREIRREAFGHCAFPGCRESKVVEIAHIKPVSEEGDNSFYNLILLCVCCHRKFDSGKYKKSGFTRERLFILKKNLMRLNSMYCTFELRLLEFFSENFYGKKKLRCENF